LKALSLRKQVIPWEDQSQREVVGYHQTKDLEESLESKGQGYT